MTTVTMDRILSDDPVGSASSGAIPAPEDAPSLPWEWAPEQRSPKFRPLLQTEPDQWDTEEKGCTLPLVYLLIALCVLYVLFYIGGHFLR